MDYSDIKIGQDVSHPVSSVVFVCNMRVITGFQYGDLNTVSIRCECRRIEWKARRRSQCVFGLSLQVLI